MQDSFGEDQDITDMWELADTPILRSDVSHNLIKSFNRTVFHKRGTRFNEMIVAPKLVHYSFLIVCDTILYHM